MGPWWLRPDAPTPGVVAVSSLVWLTVGWPEEDLRARLEVLPPDLLEAAAEVARQWSLSGGASADFLAAMGLDGALPWQPTLVVLYETHKKMAGHVPPSRELLVEQRRRMNVDRAELGLPLLSEEV